MSGPAMMEAVIGCGTPSRRCSLQGLWPGRRQDGRRIAKARSELPISTFRLTGTVKVEGTDEPVARATLQILIGNVWVRREPA